MQQHADSMPLPFKWFMIALITLALACALAAPGPGIDWSKDESLSGTVVVLQKKIYDDDDGKVVDSDQHFDAVLADSVHNPTILKAILSVSRQLAQSLPLHFNSAAPRAPPALHV